MDRSLRRFVRERAGRRCEYCRVPDHCDVLPFQPDHVIAEKHEGPTIESNLASSCYDCNMYKGPNIAGMDWQTSTVIRLFHPRDDRWPDHFDWNVGELVGKTSVGRATIATLRVNLPRRIAFRQQLRAEGIVLDGPDS